MSNFTVPQKEILHPTQLEWFKSSKTCKDILEYIQSLNDAIIGVKLTDPCDLQSPGIDRVMKMLDNVEDIAKQTPPVHNPASRFGNPAFREFYDKLQEISPALHSSTLLLSPPEAIEEVSHYLVESFGNRTRIDYGSGMELNFLCWLLCLTRLGILKETDHKAVVIKVFWRYIQVMRVLQSTYWLEPAGSHGVWGLDDYHFLPFLFGAAQLRGHKYIRPKSIHDPEIVEEHAKNYMYFACIEFINSIKTESLRWHSPMLDDISAVKTWDKVNTGMIKMYTDQVLHKLPVIQHFLFGSLLPYDGPRIDVNVNGDSNAAAGHSHTHPHPHAHGPGSETGWGDCCGIPIPSAFGAAAAAGKVPGAADEKRIPGVKLSESTDLRGIRPVPFD